MRTPVQLSDIVSRASDAAWAPNPLLAINSGRTRCWHGAFITATTTTATENESYTADDGYGPWPQHGYGPWRDEPHDEHGPHGYAYGECCISYLTKSYNCTSLAIITQMMRMFFHFSKNVPTFLFESWSVQTNEGLSVVRANWHGDQ